MRAILFLVALSTTACLRTTEFHCTTNADCSATGAVCESNGYCSFADSKCSGGQRYGDLSGPVAGQCVGDVSMNPDGGVDSLTTDTGGGGGCPSSYAALGGSAHRYRVITTTGAWASQKGVCTADGAGIYLAVPDDQAELTALVAAAAADAWVGIDDQMTEGTFKTAKGATFSSTSPLWDIGEPDAKPEAGGGANPNVDCAMAKTATNKLSDDLCSVTYKAICECEP
jgi:hypothetical protein